MFFTLLYKIFSFIILSLPVLICMGFSTLMERKILSYIQYRKGPNKVSIIGILQPFLDAMKLFSKEMLMLMVFNYFLYYFVPFFCLSLSLLLWSLMPLITWVNFIKVSWILLMALLSISVYPLLIMGWSSNCHYSYLGAVRGISQVLSYEVVFSILLFMMMLLGGSIMIDLSMKFSNFFGLIYWFPFIVILWMMVCLAETNRSPFDFSEGESELVSGFNTEYGGGLFSLIFMSEYLNIIFLSCLLPLFMISSFYLSYYLFGMMLVFFWFWVRGTFPRHRYDLLMMFCWKSMMPIVIMILVGMMLMFYDL